ncbi:MAG: hypothetical protein OQK57_03785 [Ignavibacteriaceae bacterium]|nr:hypothetical protein [Ignavibacteriaceae bacterium]
MTSIRNTIVWKLTLVAAFVIIFNNTIYVNTHILPYGKVVEHAHPFDLTEKIPDFDIEDNE